MPRTYEAPPSENTGCKQGLYIHIPFCKQRCIYCDFYSTTCGEAEKAAFAEALCAELVSRKEEAEGRQLTTIYLGGGTPSQLSGEALTRIFSTIHSAYTFDPDAEITIEANPDDISKDFIAVLQSTGVNRVSLGIQTFNEDLLKILHRRHNASQARNAVLTLHEAGFVNLSIDLIYGLPSQSLDTWRHDIDTALRLPIKHLSAYALTYEDDTQLTRLRDIGKLKEAGEETYRTSFYLLKELAEAAGFEHYEISNFARSGWHSRHNSSYWDGSPYIGCGPGAHSFDAKRTRRENRADLRAYLNTPGAPAFREEHLSQNESRNEFVFTALRTNVGVNLELLSRQFGAAALSELLNAATPYLRFKELEERDGHLRLTPAGLFLSDMIMRDLMTV